MKNLALSLLFIFASLPIFAQTAEEMAGENCTSIMVGRLASTDGSVITSHTCDGTYRTWVTIEPAADYPKGAMHQVKKGTMKTASASDTTGVTVAGLIPQARHTYAYINTAYPCMNEKQLAIGETTFVGPKELVNPDAMFLIEELQRIALQRCTTAREAVLLMGSLAEKYGYADTGECLTVADRNEVWQFEIVGVGKDKIGAAWVAQRVPDDEVAVSANVPRIGTLNEKDKANFLCSKNVKQTALENGLWDGKEEFKFWKAFNSSRENAKNFKDREFYILKTLAPSLGLSWDMEELPFSVKPEKKLGVEDVARYFRNTYEGDPFDMCKNVLIERPARGDKPAYKEISPVANPWLTTTMRNTLNTIAPNTVEFRRTIAVAWCSYSHVIQLRSWLPDAVGGICWLSVDNPGQSPRIPVFCGNTELPEGFAFCGHKGFDPDCALWTFRKANKLATLSWQTTKKGFIENVLKIEKFATSGISGLEAEADSQTLNTYTKSVYDEAARVWREMEENFWRQFGSGF